jgi:hypothetical protein
MLEPGFLQGGETNHLSRPPVRPPAFSTAFTPVEFQKFINREAGVDMWWNCKPKSGRMTTFYGVTSMATLPLWALNSGA